MNKNILNRKKAGFAAGAALAALSSGLALGSELTKTLNLNGGVLVAESKEHSEKNMSQSHEPSENKVKISQKKLSPEPDTQTGCGGAGGCGGDHGCGSKENSK